MPVCILTLAVSILFGSIWIGNSIKNYTINLNKSNNSSKGLLYNKALMTEEETSQYLNLQLDIFKKIVIQNDVARKQAGSYEDFRYIPYITINGVRYFSKEHVDKWVENNSLSRQEIQTNLK